MTQQFTGLQILRFVAAMLVVAMHGTQAISMHVTGKGDAVYWGAGGAGVDMFFVISGFVMTITTLGLPDRGPARLAAAWVFMKRRILRIVPLYWFYTLLKAALLLAIPAIAAKSTFDGGHLLTSLLFIPSVNPSSGLIQPALQVGWTLNFEMLFYLVFAIAIALGAPRARLCLLVFLAIFLAGQHYTQPVPLVFYAQSIIFEFVLGVAIAYGLKRYGAPHPAFAILLVAASTFFMFAFDWSYRTDRMYPWGMGGAAMVLGIVWLERWIARAPGARQLSFLGDASYSIYLVHTFVVPGTVIALRKVGILDPAAILVIVSAVVMVAGSLSHIWLEKPMTSFLKRYLFPDSSRSFLHAANTPAK
jgi:exopolysaccharide production protein ExoZ